MKHRPPRGQGRRKVIEVEYRSGRTADVRAAMVDADNLLVRETSRPYHFVRGYFVLFKACIRPIRPTRAPPTNPAVRASTAQVFHPVF